MSEGKIVSTKSPLMQIRRDRDMMAMNTEAFVDSIDARGQNHGWVVVEEVLSADLYNVVFMLWCRITPARYD
jgi:hypothetical protein